MRTAAYLLSGSHGDFAFLMTCGALQEQLRSFLHGLIRARQRQHRHLVQDVLCEDVDTVYHCWNLRVSDCSLKYRIFI